MSGSEWYPADRFATRGMAYDGAGTSSRVPSSHRSSKRPSRDRQPPRATSSTSPLASTTVSARTQSRVEPYLKVAAPAAFVEHTPPTSAPRKVGTGG